MEERIQRTMKALERNKIKPYYVETREQLYDLAMLSHKPLAPEEMTKFITRSNKIMMLLAK